MSLVNTIEDVEHNVIGLVHTRGDQREALGRLIKNGKLFVVLKDNKQFRFAPSRFAGYKNNSLEDHLRQRSKRDGRITNVCLDKLLGNPLDKGARGYKSIDVAFLRYCHRLNVTPSIHPRSRRYWIIDSGNGPSRSGRSSPSKASQGGSEGSKQTTFINRYERNPAARAACIAHYGTQCQVCGHDFLRQYGELGRGFVHVHHVVPISQNKGRRYEVDGIRDLRPVCPNCHAMLHAGGETRTISSLRRLIKRQAAAKRVTVRRRAFRR